MSGAAQQPVRVLFVCLGNICRSPMAEAVFQSLVDRAGLGGRVLADSAGTSSYHIGEPPHPGTLRVLRERGIAYRHAARQVAAEDFSSFDYVVALDRSNLDSLSGLTPRGASAQISLLLDHAPQAGLRDVPDPYYTGGFSEVYALAEQGCQGLLQRIVAERGLECAAELRPA